MKRSNDRFGFNFKNTDEKEPKLCAYTTILLLINQNKKAEFSISEKYSYICSVVRDKLFNSGNENRV